MKYYTYAFVLSALLFSGCANTTGPRVASQKTIYESPTTAKEAKFHETMIKVAKSTQDDPKYNRMALNTPEEKSWFKNLMYRLWDRQITRQEFIDAGVAKYPEHRYEFTYIANAYQNY